MWPVVGAGMGVKLGSCVPLSCCLCVLSQLLVSEEELVPGWGAPWPHWGLATRKQEPSSHLLAWSSPALFRGVVPRPEDGVQRDLGHSEHCTMLCSMGGTSPQPGCSWFAPTPSHQDLTFTSSYFAGTAHVTVMGMKFVPVPQLNGPFHPMATNHPHAASIC